MAFPSTMRLPLAFGALALGFAMAAPAAAQQMYPGQDVSVNPAAIGQVPYGAPTYPGGLLPPGAGNRKLPPVHLRPPKTHKRRSAPTEASTVPAPARPRHVARKPAPQPESSEATRTAIAEAPTARKPARKPTRKPVAKPAHKMAARPVAPPPAASSEDAAPASIPFSFGGGSAPMAKPGRAARPQRRQIAKAAPLPKITQPKGLTKQQVVLFDTGSAELSDSTRARLNDLAFSLKTALANGADHIELIAYGGAPGDKSSAARRLSLKRALAVREALIVDGLPAGRIDVRALGGVKPGDNGATDRVDIFVKA